MRFEESHRDVFGAYGALASFCAFNYSKMVQKWERIVKRKCCERTFLYSERRWAGDIRIMGCIRNKLFRLAKFPFLPFTPEVRRSETFGSTFHRYDCSGI